MPAKITDHLANERTFLAWIRTALGLTGFGFVLGRMGLFLNQIAVSSDAKRIRTGHEFIFVGILFLVIGAILAGWSGWKYEQNRSAIDSDRFSPSKWSIVVLTGVVVIGSLVIVGLSIWRMAEG